MLINWDMRWHRLKLGQHQSDQRTGCCKGSTAAGLRDHTGGGGATEVGTPTARKRGGLGEGTWPSVTEEHSWQELESGIWKGHRRDTGPEVTCSVGRAEEMSWRKADKAKTVKPSITEQGAGGIAGTQHVNLLQYFCLENPMDRGAWQSTVLWSQSRTPLSDCAHTNNTCM